MREFIRVACAADVPAGAMRRIDVGGHAIALVHLDDGWYAIDDTCTHEAASSSEGTLTGGVVACPRHGARFEVRTGRVLSLPAVRPVAAYPVRIEGEDVLVAPEPLTDAGTLHRRP